MYEVPVKRVSTVKRSSYHMYPLEMDTTVISPWLDKKTMAQWLGSPVKEIKEKEGASGKGDNYLSTLIHLSVTTFERKTYNLLVKKILDNAGPTEVLTLVVNVFQREEDAYTIVIPRMQELLHKALPDNFEELGPKCYFACKKFLVMEDLIVQGYYMKNRRIGLDFDDCLLVMQTLAKFHASSAVLYEKDPKTMNTFSNFYSEPVAEKAWSNWARGMSLTLAEELDTWSAEWKKYAGKLRKLSSNLMSLAIEANKQDNLGFNCLLHGDVWTNNVLFNDKGSVRFIDYQIAYFGSPALDIWYFLNTSTTLDVRRRHQFDHLIREYHTTLSATLKALGYKKKIITLEELQEELNRKIILGLFSLICPCAVMSCDPDAGFSFDDAFGKGVTPGTKMYGERYKEIVKLQLPEYEEKGAFDGDLNLLNNQELK